MKSQPRVDMFFEDFHFKPKKNYDTYKTELKTFDDTWSFVLVGVSNVLFLSKSEINLIETDNG